MKELSHAFIDPAAENTIEDENDADFELDDLFKEPNNRSMDVVIEHAQQLIFVDAHIKEYFFSKAKELLKGTSGTNKGYWPMVAHRGSQNRPCFFDEHCASKDDDNGCDEADGHTGQPIGTKRQDARRSLCDQGCLMDLGAKRRGCCFDF